MKMTKKTYLVEVLTTRPEPDTLMEKLARELELMYGKQYCRVWEYKEPIHWVNGD